MIPADTDLFPNTASRKQAGDSQRDRGWLCGGGRACREGPRTQGCTDTRALLTPEGRLGMKHRGGGEAANSTGSEVKEDRMEGGLLGLERAVPALINGVCG